MKPRYWLLPANELRRSTTTIFRFSSTFLHFSNFLSNSIRGSVIALLSKKSERQWSFLGGKFHDREDRETVCMVMKDIRDLKMIWATI